MFTQLLQRAVVNRILADVPDTVDDDSTVAFNCTSTPPVGELTECATSLGLQAGEDVNIEFYVNGQPRKLILKSEAY